MKHDATGSNMSRWSTRECAAIAGSDDFHIAPYRPDGRTPGTLTWIWSVVVDGRVFVRPWHGPRSRWYRAAEAQGAGRITAGGLDRTVELRTLDDEQLNARVDDAYRVKYAGSPYLPPMVAAGPRRATVEVLPAD